MKKLLAIALAASFISFGFIAHAIGPGAGAGVHDQGIAVKSWKGEHLGTSKVVVVDSSTGNIVFIVVSLSEGRHKEIAVPLSAFSVDVENGFLILNVSKKDLAAAPAYDDSILKDRNFAEKVYHFFGVAPPWTYELPKTEM